MNTMKVLIQNVATGEYLTHNGNWSLLPSHGKDFRFSSYARSVVRKEKSPNLRALFYFEDYDYCVNARRPIGERLAADLSVGGMDF
jgi:hypothetical protein